jgi:MFS superfamily sulfate permease-like transporter
VLWTSFAPAKLKWIPGALLGVLAATTVATLFSMPVRYVDLPDSLLGAIQFTPVSALGSLADPALIGAALGLAFVASAETLLSAAAVDQMHDGPRANYDKELLSQGIGNTLCGLVGGLPMTGVIVRSATNVAAGAKTRKSAMLHGAWLLLLVAVFPQVLRLVPTASLAAILVYTGYKLVNPANVRRLLSFGPVPGLIYAATVIVIVSVDLLAGIVTGIVLSLAKVLWALSKLTIDVEQAPSSPRVDVTISGAATFLRLPKLVDTLDGLPKGSEVHLHLKAMRYIDHASIEAISSWEKQWPKSGGKVVMEWDQLLGIYRDRNHFGPLRPGDLRVAMTKAAAH